MKINKTGGFKAEEVCTPENKPFKFDSICTLGKIQSKQNSVCLDLGFPD